MDILAALNPEQRRAVAHTGGPLLILAGPGSGKTRVITHRIAHIIQEDGVHPYRIMAVTFTNKAAREMKERLRSLIGPMADDVTMGTFHAVCTRMLRAEADHVGLDRRFVIYDDDDQMEVIKRCLITLEVDTKRFSPRSVLSSISQAKSQLLEPQDYRSQSYFEEVVRRAYEEYQHALTEAKALDFDDLIMRTVLLLRENPAVLEKYQSRYLHLLIDEFQDTNVAQYVWARMLAEQHRNICVVGDPDQSIYSWRSADIRNILNFEQDYPEAAVVHLEQNYRSTKTILEAAHNLIAVNRQRKDVQLWTENDAGSPITVREGYDEEEEAYYVAQELERLVVRGSYDWRDCAVMYRTNAQSRALEEALVRSGTPYKLVGATRFYERREVKDILAYLRLSMNPFDNVSLQRVINVPGRGIGQRTLEELNRWAAAHRVPRYTALQLLLADDDSDAAESPPALGDKPKFTTKTTGALQQFLRLLNELIQAAETQRLDAFFELLLARVGYRRFLLDNYEEDGEDRWENIQELQTVAQQFSDAEPEEGLTSFLENVSLVSDLDSLEESQDSVTLITLHQAKGLEYPVVFITGLEEGVLPHMRSFDNPNQMEEERRLAYVGFTRAKQRLYLLRAFRRGFAGNRMHSPPSRFLRDLPAHLTEGGRPNMPSSQPMLSPPTPRAVPRPQPTRIPANAPPAREAAPSEEEAVEARFSAGDHVRHKQFGEGIVLSCVPDRSDFLVTVAFKGESGIKKLLLSFAPLEKVE